MPKRSTSSAWTRRSRASSRKTPTRPWSSASGSSPGSAETKPPRRWASRRARSIGTGRSPGRGSLRLEWFRTLADGGDGLPGGLQLHTQLFTGYGDSLLDYNRKRTVFSLGLSLVEW